VKFNYKKSFLGSILAFILGTSCCWLTSLAVWLGGATLLTVISKFAHQYNTIILSVALLFFLIGLYQFWKHKKRKTNKIISIAIFMLTTFSLSAQHKIDHKTQILGKWKTDDNRAIIEIFEQGGKYHGKIVWLQKATDKQGKARKDIQNPNKEKQSETLIGLTILKNFTFDKNEFISGTVYDPDSGSTYNCKLWLIDNNTLKVRDYCGIFYMTFTWKRTI
jgi:uncharacterized protein (DUF2147 family)